MTLCYRRSLPPSSDWINTVVVLRDVPLRSQKTSSINRTGTSVFSAISKRLAITPKAFRRAWISFSLSRLIDENYHCSHRAEEDEEKAKYSQGRERRLGYASNE